MTRLPIDVPSLAHPDMTAEEGYHVQRMIIATKVARGAPVIGKKIRLTSRANQEVFGVHEPVYGQLLDTGVYTEQTPVQTAALIQPIIECELTFVMRRPLAGPGITVPDVLRATEGIMPSLEIGDSRMRDWIGRHRSPISWPTVVAPRRIIVGGELHALQGFDLRYTGMVVEKNGVIIASGATGAVMGNPAHAVAWLVNKLALLELALNEGDMVLSGALTGAVRVGPGDIVKATFGGGLGPVGVTFI